MQRPEEAHNGDEQQEDAHRDHAADDVDAGHQAEALPPRRYANEQQADQLRSRGRKSSRVT